MNISELGYVVLESPKLDEWRKYTEDFLGMEVAYANSDSLTLRIDERQCRYLIKKSDKDQMGAVGWIVHARKELDNIRKELKEHGLAVIESTEEEKAERFVSEMIATIDPIGVRHEFAWGPVANFRVPFNSKIGIKKFVTGKQGMGHVVFGVPAEKFELQDRFIEDVLGMGLANFRRRSVFPERSPVPLNWYAYANGRHHSLAIGEITRDHAIQHIMLELDDIDDVGRAIDRAERLEVPMASTLGRHANDRSIGFYSVSPSGFWFEYAHVLPGQDYDEVCWDDGNGGSRWGHKYLVDF